MAQDNPRPPRSFKPNRTDRPSQSYTPPAPPLETTPATFPQSDPEVVKLPFIQWFNAALNRYPKLKPLHMHAVRAYFMSKGLSDPDTAARYDSMLKIYGL